MIEDIIRKFFNAPPSPRRIQADLRAMMDVTRQYQQNIIPWEAEREMELLSLNREFKWVKGSFDKILRGVFFSIYNEPMLTYAFKSYVKEGHFALLYAATSSHQFVYHKQRERVEFFIDDQHVGHITKDWLLYSNRGRLLGRRNRFSSESFTVIIWDKEVAHVRDASRPQRVNSRAFEVMTTLQEAEQLLLMAVAFLTMVDGAHDVFRKEM
jgi:hypothetical protein